MYKAIFFDAGSTLIDAKLTREERFLYAAQEQGLHVDPAAVAALHQQLWQKHFSSKGLQDMNEAEADATWRRFYQDLLAGLALADPGGTLAARLAVDCDWLPWMYVHAEVPAVLAQLQRDFKLGLLSNAPPALRGLMQRLGLAGYFQQMTISGEVGVRKPNQGIYRIALDSLGVEAEGALFVDDIEENLVAARQMGMDGLLIDYKNAVTCSEFPRITDLNGVLDVLSHTGQDHGH